jgi:glucokinase
MTATKPFANDTRVVLTLDAGGTSFRFTAIAGNREVGPGVTLATRGDDLAACLAQLVDGFSRVREEAGGAVAALSFAFPGPADYAAGVIGDLGNLPAFRGGVALGPMLEDRFGVPVFISNDGDLFAYGEALHGLLPEVNRLLADAGSPKRYRNLLGVTLGTGFGGGIVRDGELFVGDNGAAGEIWLQRHKLERGSPAEDGVSIRAVRSVYARRAGIAPEEAPEPSAIAAIARGAAGKAPGDEEAAREAFRRLGEVAGDAIANALTLVDGLVVVGGGLAGAAELFLPALVAELNGALEHESGARVPSLELSAFNLEDAKERERFLADRVREVLVPGSSRKVPYEPEKRTGVGLSRLGTSRAVSLGAYAWALRKLGGSS